MKFAIAIICMGSALVAQTPSGGINGSGSLGIQRLFSPLIQSAGSDCIFALHADTITGMTCANAVTDGTAETAFINGVSIPGNTFSSNTVTVNSTFLVKTSNATTPTIVFSLRLGGISGTLIYQSAALSPAVGTAVAAISMTAIISALDAASASTHLVANVVQANNLAVAVRNTLLSNTTQSIAVNATTTQTLVWTVTYSANTAGNAIGLYTMTPGTS